MKALLTGAIGLVVLAGVLAFTFHSVSSLSEKEAAEDKKDARFVIRHCELCGEQMNSHLVTEEWICFNCDKDRLEEYYNK